MFLSGKIRHSIWSLPADVQAHLITPTGRFWFDRRPFYVCTLEKTCNKVTLLTDYGVVAPAKRVMSLRNPLVKMSKSDPDRKSRVLITDAPDSIRATIKGALTDSCYDRIFYDRRERPGIANLLEIWSHFDEKGRSPETLALEYQRLIIPHFKERVSDAIIDGLAGIREKYTRVMAADEGRYVDYVASKGAERARQSAEQTMELVREVVGLTSSRGLSSKV